jgi:AcrR family transcriptional regulator
MTPAPVDHDARRAHLSGVLERVIDERGLEGASIRAVAAAAGVSIGTVQHYFPTKDDLLRHAYRRSEAAIEARIESRLEGVTDRRAALRAIVLELLPLDPERLFAIRVAAAFAVRALYEPALEREVGADLHELRRIVTGLLDGAGIRHARREAIALLALVDGLTDQLLYRSGGVTPDDAVEVLDSHLEHVLGRTTPRAG